MAIKQFALNGRFQPQPVTTIRRSNVVWVRKGSIWSSSAFKAVVDRGYHHPDTGRSADLKSGAGTHLIPGRIRAIRFATEADERVSRWNTFPMSAGDLLNLRDIQQALKP